MDTFLWLGMALGLVVGVLHAMLVYRRRLSEGGAGRLEAAYFALWALSLWILFGAYVLAFWLIGVAGMAVWRLTRSAESGT